MRSASHPLEEGVSLSLESDPDARFVALRGNLILYFGLVVTIIVIWFIDCITFNNTVLFISCLVVKPCVLLDG